MKDVLSSDHIENTIKNASIEIFFMWNRWHKQIFLISNSLLIILGGLAHYKLQNFTVFSTIKENPNYSTPESFMARYKKKI